MDLLQLGTLPAWAALVLSGLSIFYTWRVSKRQLDPSWTFIPLEAGGYELRNVGRNTAYGVTYKAPMEIFEQGQDVRWEDDDTPVRNPVDMPGGSAIGINTFKIVGATERRLYVYWYKKRGMRGKRHEWSTELPPHPGHMIKPK